MKHMSVKIKMTLLSLLIFLIAGTVIILAALSMKDSNEKQLASLEETLRSEYDYNIKQQVITAISMLDGLYQQSEDGTITLEEAKQLILMLKSYKLKLNKKVPICFVNSVMTTMAISGQTSMMEQMWFFSAMKQKEPTVWIPQISTATKW